MNVDLSVFEMIAMVVAVPLVTFLKKDMDIEGKLALLISAIVALVLALLSTLFGQTEVFKTAVVIFAGAQAIYNVLKKTLFENL